MEHLFNAWQYAGEIMFLENPLQSIIIAAFILLLMLLLRRFMSVQFSRLAFRLVKRISYDVPVKEFVDLLKSPMELCISLALVYMAFSWLKYPEWLNIAPESRLGLKSLVKRGFELWVFIAFLWLGFRVVDFFSLVIRKRAIESESKLQEQLVPFLRQFIKLGVLTIFFFAALAYVFEVNIGTLIAGLGIGGAALALAGKETLENLLASFTIFFDKPFVAGELIKTDKFVGTVEYVGFRTTRIRTTDRSLVTVPNKLLIDQPLENLASRTQHRVRFTIGVPYATDNQTMAQVIKSVKEMLENHSMVDKNSINLFFDGFSAYSLDIAVIYVVNVAAFPDFWKIKDEINFRIKEIVDSSNTDFEFPTSIVYLRNEDKTKSIK